MSDSQLVSRRNFLFGAFKTDADPGDEAERTVAQVNKSCLVNAAVACRSCEDFCEARAIRFRPKQGGHYFPEINADLCTSCGDCLSACPVQAISMVGDNRYG